jgi:hypothetical protein
MWACTKFTIHILCMADFTLVESMWKRYSGIPDGAKNVAQKLCMLSLLVANEVLELAT